MGRFMIDRPDILASIEEVSQPRSRFQLERFVLGQHDTIEMAFHQVCLELQGALVEYKKSALRVEKAQAEIDELKESDRKADQIEAQIREIDLEDSRLLELGFKRELDHLIEMYDQFPHKFTREEIEAAQPVYWQARLGRQAELQAIGQGKVDWAQLNAIHQAGFLSEFIEKTGITSSEKKELGNA